MMNLVLEKPLPNSTQVKTDNVDYFDATGVPLNKCLPYTKNIRKCQELSELNVLPTHLHPASSSRQVKSFPKNVYVKLVGSLWGIYHGTKIISPEQIEKTVIIVEMILKEFERQSLYLDFAAMHLEVERFKRHDYWRFTHVVNVALLCTMTGLQLGYAGQRLKCLTLGALFHDLGKLKVPADILNKPASLSKEEYSIVKSHPLEGAKMLETSRLSNIVIYVIREHHERWNGKGYPFGLKGNDIHFDAQIVAVADVYEAMTANRPYRQGIHPYHVLEMTDSWSGKDFNPTVVQSFQRIFHTIS